MISVLKWLIKDVLFIFNDYFDMSVKTVLNHKVSFVCGLIYRFKTKLSMGFQLNIDSYSESRVHYYYEICDNFAL